MTKNWGEIWDGPVQEVGHAAPPGPGAWGTRCLVELFAERWERGLSQLIWEISSADPRIVSGNSRQQGRTPSSAPGTSSTHMTPVKTNVGTCQRLSEEAPE